MAQAVITVLILILFVAYAVFFAVWNPDMVQVVGFEMGGSPMGAQVPMFVLPLAGLLIGAIVMAIAMVTPWSWTRRALKDKSDELEAEKRRSAKRAQQIESLQERVSGLKNQLEGRSQPSAARSGGQQAGENAGT